MNYKNFRFANNYFRKNYTNQNFFKTFLSNTNQNKSFINFSNSLYMTKILFLKNTLNLASNSRSVLVSDLESSQSIQESTQTSNSASLFNIDAALNSFLLGLKGKI